METVKAKEKEMVVVQPSVRRERYLATEKHQRYKILFVCLLYFFVASFLLRGEFSFLFFLEALLIFLDPGFEIV